MTRLPRGLRARLWTARALGKLAAALTKTAALSEAGARRIRLDAARATDAYAREHRGAGK